MSRGVLYPYVDVSDKYGDIRSLAIEIQGSRGLVVCKFTDNHKR